MVRLSGAALGFLAFAITIFTGLSAGVSHEVIIGRAISAMILLCVVGLFTGWVAQRVLDEHALKMHREMFNEIEEESLDPTDGRTDEHNGNEAVDRKKENKVGAAQVTAGT